MTSDEFWKYQVNVSATSNLRGFRFDDDALAEYERIARYCREHGIRLTFVLLPEHADIHRRIADFGLDAEWHALPARLGALAETVDLDTDNAITTDRTKFTDPYHMTLDGGAAVVRAVFAGPR